MLYNNISELSLIEYTILVTQQRLIMPELSSSIFLPQKHFVDKSKKKVTGSSSDTKTAPVVITSHRIII
jgi:hypothetical protein